MNNRHISQVILFICLFCVFATPIASAHNHKPHRPHYKPHRPKPPVIVVKPHKPHKPHRPHYKPHRPKPPVIVVKPHRPHKPIKRLKRYLRETLPRRATFAVIAGISYAIIDNIYYEKRGHEYHEVRSPR